MFTFHRVHRGGEKEQLVMYCNMTDAADFDLRQAMQCALLEFCRTPEGREMVKEGRLLDYSDFVNFVPAEICMRHGFYKTLPLDEATVMAGSTPMMGKYDIACYLQQCDQAQERATRLHNASVGIAQMLGSMRRGDSPVPEVRKMDSETMTLTTICWAEEYVNTGADDLGAFVRAKVRNLS